MRLDHPIFKGPLAVDIDLRPNDWGKDFDDRGVWQVQTGKMGSENDYGVVSDGHGFEDSPDCERISGGINSKSPYALAIGRQANMLQWGFYAAPDRMTASARKVFLNAIVYMKQFDGRKPLVKKVSRSRSWFQQYLAAVRELPDKDAKYRESYAKYLKQQFPKQLIAKVGLDAKALEKWFKDNVEYMRAKQRWTFVVDSDLAKLGISNRKPEFLDWLTKSLNADSHDELALRLAKRYLGDDHSADAKTALAYIEDNRGKLFFSDTGGYRWFVNTNPPVKKPSRQSNDGVREFR